MVLHVVSALIVVSNAPKAWEAWKGACMRVSVVPRVSDGMLSQGVGRNSSLTLLCCCCDPAPKVTCSCCVPCFTFGV